MMCSSHLQLIFEQFSEDFFQLHKRKVQQCLENAEREPKGPPPASGGAAQSSSISIGQDGKYEETEANLLQVVNTFISLKKSNLNYPTIKRHLLKHFSVDFFNQHKSIVQQRLENAYRRDSSNGGAVGKLHQPEDQAAQRKRQLRSILANADVILSDMKIAHKYPLTDRFVCSCLFMADVLQNHRYCHAFHLHI